MSARSFSRKDLKHDEFVTTTGEITRWLMERRRRIGWGLLAIVVLISIFAMVQVYHQRQESSAAALLAVAMEVYRTPVAAETLPSAEQQTPAAGETGEDQSTDPPADAATTDDAADSASTEDPAGSATTEDPVVTTETSPDAAVETPEGTPAATSYMAPPDEHSTVEHRHFATEVAKCEAAREEFSPIVRRYGNTASGRVASFYLGICESSLGNPEAGVEALQRAAGASQEIIATVALYRLGQLHLAEGRAEEAVASFDLLLGRNSDSFPPDEALMSKARAQEAAGDSRGAMLSYQRVVDEHPDSFSAADARTRVEELSAELGLDPDVERS